MSRINPFAINDCDHKKRNDLKLTCRYLHQAYLYNLNRLCERSLMMYDRGFDRWKSMSDDERSRCDEVYAQLLVAERHSLSVYLEAVAQLQQYLLTE